MGNVDTALFYYGIPLKPGFQEYKPELFLREIDEFRPPEWVSNETKWYREIELEKFGMERLDERWKDSGDPVSIQWVVDKAGISGSVSFLAIRETIQRNDQIDSITGFDLPNAPREAWNQLLRAKCEENGLRYEKPSFRIWMLDEGGAIFFYGIRLLKGEAAIFMHALEDPPPERPSWVPVRRGWEDQWHDAFYEYLVDDEGIENLDWEWEENGDPVFINRFTWADDEDEFALGIREIRHVIPDDNCYTSFQLDFVETAQWDQLLRGKCEKYNIAWRKPAFQLTFEIL